MRQLLRIANDAPEWREAKPPHATAVIVARVRFFGSGEQELVAAYGISGCEVIADAQSFPKMPAKFDRISYAGRNYTIQMVRPDYVEGAIVFYRCFCEG